jgi:uncharacterized protein
LKVPQTLITAANRALDDLMSEVKGVVAAVVSTADGFEVAGRVQNDAQISKLAAMASSIAAIGIVVGEESGVGEQESITIEAKEGYVVMVGIDNKAFPMILNVIAQKSAVLGQVLYFTKQSARSLVDAS